MYMADNLTTFLFQQSRNSEVSASWARNRPVEILFYLHLYLYLNLYLYLYLLDISGYIVYSVEC